MTTNHLIDLQAGVIGVESGAVSAQAYGNGATDGPTLSAFDIGAASSTTGNSRSGSTAIMASAALGTMVACGGNAGTVRASGDQGTAGVVDRSAR